MNTHSVVTPLHCTIPGFDTPLAMLKDGNMPDLCWSPCGLVRVPIRAPVNGTFTNSHLFIGLYRRPCLKQGAVYILDGRQSGGFPTIRDVRLALCQVGMPALIAIMYTMGNSFLIPQNVQSKSLGVTRNQHIRC